MIIGKDPPTIPLCALCAYYLHFGLTQPEICSLPIGLHERACFALLLATFLCCSRYVIVYSRAKHTAERHTEYDFRLDIGLTHNTRTEEVHTLHQIRELVLLVVVWYTYILCSPDELVVNSSEYVVISETI